MAILTCCCVYTHIVCICLQILFCHSTLGLMYIYMYILIHPYVFIEVKNTEKTSLTYMQHIHISSKTCTYIDIYTTRD